MAKYAVSLGEFSDTVILEASSPQVALDNVLVTRPPHSIALVPKEDKKETWWFARNTTTGAKDELVVKDTIQARKMLSRVRNDHVEIFWFVDVHEHSHSLKNPKKPTVLKKTPK